jgi:hypothetical protein
MKAKKALKKLRSVEALLSIVIDQFAANERSVRALLDSAKASVIGAKAKINSLSTAETKKKSRMMGKETKHAHLTPEGRKRISQAAKKRWAEAKRALAKTSGVLSKSAPERDAPKIGSPTSRRAKPQDSALAPEALPEPNQERHEPQAN